MNVAGDRPRGSILRIFTAIALLGCSSNDSAAAEGGTAPSIDPCVELEGADPRSVERGQCAVVERGCDNCHQSPDPQLGVLSGQTTPRLGTMSYPANLTPDPSTGLGLWTNDQIVRAIRVGLDANTEALCFVMTRFDRMGDDEAYAIAHYLKSLPPVHQQIPPSTCPPVKPRADAGDAPVMPVDGSDD